MKNILFILFCSTFFISCLFDITEDVATNILDLHPLKNLNNWEVIWEDNFDSLDSNFWSVTPRGNPSWKKYMTDYDGCYEIRNGNLVLKGIKNTFLPEDTASYLTGGIWTSKKKTISYGRVEVKARIKKTQGAWPAIWMISDERPWPFGGEIDIFESRNFENDIYQTLHSPYTLSNKSLTNNHMITYVEDKSQFNTYGVIINKKEIIFTINNKITFFYQQDSLIYGDQQFPYMDEKNLILSMQLDSPWTGRINNDQLPAEMEIDWVRFYKKRDSTLPDY